jgi:hypothetical protein
MKSIKVSELITQLSMLSPDQVLEMKTVIDPESFIPALHVIFPIERSKDTTE